VFCVFCGFIFLVYCRHNLSDSLSRADLAGNDRAVERGQFVEAHQRGNFQASPPVIGMAAMSGPLR
jgi:hypothetical protein